MLTVEAVAILGSNVKIWSLPKPARHHNVIKLMADSGEPIPICGEQGFILNDGRFVGRKAAANVAIKAKQIESLKWPPNLYSEDMW